MLPSRALNLIREYSKPVTRFDWRKGALHAPLITNSPYMNIIRDCVKFELVRIRNNIYNKPFLKQMENLFSGIYDYDDINYIQKYGEELLIFITFNYYTENTEKYINFYYYSKQLLTDTYKLRLIRYSLHKQIYYEWLD